MKKKDILEQIPGRDIFEKIGNSTSYFTKLVDDYCDKKEDVENDNDVISVQKLLEILENFYTEYRNLKYYEYHNKGCCDFLKRFVENINQDYQEITSSKKGQLDKEKTLFLLGNLFQGKKEKSDTIRCVESKGYIHNEFLIVYFKFLKYGYMRRLTLIKCNNISIFDEETNFEESKEFLNKYYEQIEAYFNILEKRKGYIPQSQYLGDFPKFSVNIGDEIFTGIISINSSGEVTFEIKVKDDDSILDFGDRSNMTEYIKNNRQELLEKMPVRVSSINEPLKSIVVSSLEEEEKKLFYRYI